MLKIYTKLNKDLIKKLKSKNIDLDILDNLSINELINIIQNIKQKISYISNFSNESQQFNIKNIENDLKININLFEINILLNPLNIFL